jgi:ABC-type nitrate/sulfonate/bicarbonate transport system permease component
MTPAIGPRLTKRLAQIACALIVITVIWHVTVIGLGIPGYIVPLPQAVAQAFIAKWPLIAGHAGFTVSAAAAGLTVSAFFASAMAISFSINRNLEQASMPIVLVFRSLPVAAVAPIMTLFLGRGIGTSIAVVTIISFFPMLVNLMRGFASVDRNAAELLYVYGASRLQQMRLVRVPYALPYLFTGLRISGSSAILGAMLSEWITGSDGLGKLILDSSEMREIELLWAAVLTSIAIALIVFWSTSAAEKRLLRWKT